MKFINFFKFFKTISFGILKNYGDPAWFIATLSADSASALRVTQAVTRLTVNRLSLHNSAVRHIGREVLNDLNDVWAQKPSPCATI